MRVTRAILLVLEPYSGPFDLHTAPFHTSIFTTMMSSDDDMRTARAARYRKVMKKSVVTTQGESEEAKDPIPSMMVTPSRSHQRSPNNRYQAFARACICDTAAHSTPYNQHVQPTDLAQQMGDYERECPPTIDRDSVGDTRSWKSPQPIWAPVRFPEWPYPPSPPSSPPSLPSKSPSPSPWNRLRRRPHSPYAHFKRLNLYFTVGSPSPDGVWDSAQFSHTLWKKPGREEHREPSPVLGLTTELEGERIAEEFASIEALRMEREERERIPREKQSCVQTAVDTTYGLLRDYLTRKGSQVTFNKGFNLAPRRTKCERKMPSRL